MLTNITKTEGSTNHNVKCLIPRSSCVTVPPQTVLLSFSSLPCPNNVDCLQLSHFPVYPVQTTWIVYCCQIFQSTLSNQCGLSTAVTCSGLPRSNNDDCLLLMQLTSSLCELVSVQCIYITSFICQMWSRVDAQL